MLRYKTMTRIVFAFLFLGLLIFQNTHCQSLGKPSPGYKSTIGAASSTGLFFNKDAYFWGFGVDYSRLLNEKWVVNISLGYDQEISKPESTIINTITPSLAFGYILTSKFVVGLDLGKGLYDDENEKGNLEFNKNGDYTAGLIGVYTIYQKGCHGFDITAGLEQAINVSDLDVTVELGYGYSF
jgi:hypothetical protein